MADPHTASSVLIAHHESIIAQHLRDMLVSDGHRVHVVHDRLATLYQARTRAPDVLLISVELAGRHDFDLCRQLHFDARARLVPVILVSEVADREPRWP